MPSVRSATSRSARARRSAGAWPHAGCGTVVNPLIVEGQLHGGIAQGLGAALLEEIAYSADGQPLTTTFLDYLAPVSTSMPDITIEHMQIPSPYTPGGMKGMGEGGTNGAMACEVQRCGRRPPGDRRSHRPHTLVAITAVGDPPAELRSRAG